LPFQSWTPEIMDAGAELFNTLADLIEAAAGTATAAVATPSSTAEVDPIYAAIEATRAARREADSTYAR